VIELVAAGVFGLFGVVSAFRSLSRPAGEDEDGRARLLIALHDAAKALFWFSLGGFFLAYGIADEPQGVRWLALIPIAMAGVRLLAATALSRS
jgi:hypothetical protein